MEAKLFKALGDPLRLRIVKKLSDGSAYTLGDITEGLGISRQGARKQVGVLEAAHIVELTSSGREVKVSLNLYSLKMGKDFIINLEKQWDKHLMKLKEFLEKK